MSWTKAVYNLHVQDSELQHLTKIPYSRKIEGTASIEGLGFRPSLMDLTPEKCETEKEKNSIARKWRQ
jgi:hypothetical protein